MLGLYALGLIWNLHKKVMSQEDKLNCIARYESQYKKACLKNLLYIKGISGLTLIYLD